MQETLVQNKAIVTRFNKAYIEAGDINVLHELMHPDFINHTALPGMSPRIDGIINTIDMFRSAFPDLVVEIHDQVAENDLVVTRKTLTGTHSDTFLGVPASGRKIRVDTIDIIRLRDGKYLEHWAIRDMMNVMQQLKG
ncbi:MAG: ester cyclase [Bacteroidetes bacterium]|nr:ester cyclase [Bacteroidota bacterium]